MKKQAKSSSDVKGRKRPLPQQADKSSDKGSLGAATPVIAVDDESFPRGGSTGLSHLERRAVEIEARAEFENELQQPLKRPKLDGKVKNT